MSKIEAQSPQSENQEGKRLMIIKLRKYNKVRELLIEIGTTGLQGHVCYWDRGQRVSVTMGCPHKEGEDGDANKTQGAYNWPPREKVCAQPLQSNQRSTSMQ